MLYRAVVAAVCVLLLAGCQRAGSGQSSIAGVAAPPALPTRAVDVPLKATDVPFSGEVTGGLAFVANPQSCPSGVTGLSNATGTALHMGKMTYHTEQCVTQATGVIDGKVLVLTAANSDELHGTFTGQSEPSGGVGHQFNVTATFVFKGGTGRFEHATGTATMTALLTHTASFPWPGRWEWTGTIRY